MLISPSQRRAQLADTRCQHARRLCGAPSPRLTSFSTPPNPTLLSMAFPSSAPTLSFRPVLHSSRRRPPSRLRPGVLLPLIYDPSRRRPPSSLRRRQSTVPAGHGCKNDMFASSCLDEGSGEPGRPRLEAPSPPHLERAIRSRRRPRQTPGWIDGGPRNQAAPGSLPPIPRRPRHSQTDSLRSSPPLVSFFSRTPREDIETGSSSMQDGWVVLLSPTPRRPGISPPTLALPADGDDDDQPYLTPPPPTPFPRGPRREDQEVRSTGTPGRLARRGTWSTRLRPTLARGVDALRRGMRWSFFLSHQSLDAYLPPSGFSSSSPARPVVFSSALMAVLRRQGTPRPPRPPAPHAHHAHRHPTPTGTPLPTHTGLTFLQPLRSFPVALYYHATRITPPRHLSPTLLLIRRAPLPTPALVSRRVHSLRSVPAPATRLAFAFTRLWT
ncbi:hypothetical protein DFH09DRAFT_1376613, partial [Mycena vulgaris]